MIVALKTKNSSYADLSADQPYFVIGIDADDYRILNDAGKPYLYPPELFDVIDSAEPKRKLVKMVNGIRTPSH